MTKIAILTDSSAYLPPELVKQYGIYVIPLTVLWGSETLLDGVEITPAEFLKRLAEDPVHPSTTQPNPDDFRVLYEQLATEFDAIVAPLISDELSGTVNSAQTAANDFNRVPVRVVDTRSTSMGLGFSVLAAARAAAQGKSLEEVEEAARDAAARSRVLFVVDTLEYLHRGGRIGGASKIFGSALNIKPLLHLYEGHVDTLEKVRTKKKAIDRMLDWIAQYTNGRPIQTAVVHAGVPEEAEALKSRVSKQWECPELLLTTLSPAIAIHTGPGTLGLAVCPVQV
ncbi:MAG: DegV family protein [Anaerolineales bacterium]|nr:DegV family protein [Anaerolineales bacterium]